MKKNIKNFIREEDGRTIKKSLLVSSLGLVAWFSMTAWVETWYAGDSHSSSTGTAHHASTHANHSNHSSY